PITSVRRPHPGRTPAAPRTVAGQAGGQAAPANSAMADALRRAGLAGGGSGSGGREDRRSGRR
ncbi:hypothetical protein, partial [Kitasatospora sp. NPDC047058]|uniref:hypothetical protein n=1 Tax=Kitasatospora sp. NPDC047058 TaxID=3155620 RepID=UPI0033BFDDCD